MQALIKVAYQSGSTSYSLRYVTTISSLLVWIMLASQLGPIFTQCRMKVELTMFVIGPFVGGTRRINLVHPYQMFIQCLYAIGMYGV